MHLNRSSHAIRWIVTAYLLIAAAAIAQNANTQQVKKPTPPSAPPLVATAIPAPAAVATPAPPLKEVQHDNFGGHPTQHAKHATER